MTTEITKSLSPRLPRPDRYAAHLDTILGPDRPVRRFRDWGSGEFFALLGGLVILLCVLAFFE